MSPLQLRSYVLIRLVVPPSVVVFIVCVTCTVSAPILEHDDLGKLRMIEHETTPGLDKGTNQAGSAVARNYRGVTSNMATSRE